MDFYIIASTVYDYSESLQSSNFAFAINMIMIQDVKMIKRKLIKLRIFYVRVGQNGQKEHMFFVVVARADLTLPFFIPGIR